MRALDHAAVARDAVLVVHDVVAGLEVVEERAGVAAPRSRPAVGAAPAGEVGLGEHRELDRREDEAAVERRDDDVTARRVEVGRARELDREVEADRQEQVVRAAAAEPSPSAATTTR